ncbi:sugar-binding transcriptional regulator [Cereibacter johrii]|uniref:sugar-binding transcriptional regulator n=1 Tax=Cereibacter johrii TaxID=445629 RepID=UPI000DCCA548|nr:sugar-binding transcriptional regulator [Cereibacter johrii]MEA5160642.1 sugar-binding transcriptional regulator [Cereibacter johrii]RAZ84865.1 sugar-binding transcriptional regulator [Cereibacter johrii]
MVEQTRSDFDEALMARVAWLYYNDGLTQNEVGEILNISRIKVSRLLDQGRSSGLIQVRINSRQQGCLELETRMKREFGLADCRVIPESPVEDVNLRVGQAAAQYLMQKLAFGETISVGWGETVTHSIRMLGHTAQERGIGLYSLTGGVQTYVEGMREANWHRNVNIIPAPLVVSTPELARALMQEPAIAALMARALEADYKLVGIGGLGESATVVTQGYISAGEIDPLRRGGARGDILCRFYDRRGRDIGVPLHERVVGVDLDQLRRSERVIGAAGGPAKTGPILSALRGEILDILITDEPTALALLDAAEA